MNCEINKHPEQLKKCPQCGWEYLVQGGGQKSGTSPAIHVGEKKVVGYCSSRCLASSLGVKIEDTLEYKTFKEWGLNYDEIFPVGYLSPARRVKTTDSF